MSRCTLGVGCEEYGVCYAEAHGEPDRCGRPPPMCPRCKGSGDIPGVGGCGLDTYAVDVPCSACGGTGAPGASRPAAWQVDFDPPRACAACEHGREGACKRPEVGERSFTAARATGGACGPDARYLTIGSVDYSKETP